MLKEEGLGKYVDAKCLQREIAEATDMTPEEMDSAARELIRQRTPRGPYYEHLGGYSAQELKDYNQYSTTGDNPRQQLSSHYPLPDDEDEEESIDDKRVHVTAL